MEKFSRKHLKEIRKIVQNRTGANLGTDGSRYGYRTRLPAVCAGFFLCLICLSAFTWAKFSGLNGDDAAFAAVYLGEGKFDIVIRNFSDRELELQDRVKLMQWSTGEEVEGENGKIRMDVSAIAPHSQGIVSVDISEGYDVEAMEEGLPEGDWYYFVLTNHNFVFGQDWMCAFDFETGRTEEAEEKLALMSEERPEAPKPQYGTGSLMNSDWSWPTESRDVSVFYGAQENGIHSDHINIAGTSGDEIYAVADGVVLETAYTGAYGNYILVDLGEGFTVRYGHLKEIKVSGGDEVSQGQVIGTLGQTGRATGPNLLFGVMLHGEAVNPLAAE